MHEKLFNPEEVSLIENHLNLLIAAFQKQKDGTLEHTSEDAGLLVDFFWEIVNPTQQNSKAAVEEVIKEAPVEESPELWEVNEQLHLDAGASLGLWITEESIRDKRFSLVHSDSFGYCSVSMNRNDWSQIKHNLDNLLDKAGL